MAKRETNKECLEQWGVEYIWSDRLLHPFGWLWVRMKEKWRHLRCCRQRFKKGYSDCDLWEMRDWFIQTAKPMLREMSSKACSYPEDVGEDRWREILLEMADLLEIMDIWDDTAARKQVGLASEGKSADAMRMISAEKEKAKNRFFFLFNKWFYDLWY